MASAFVPAVLLGESEPKGAAEPSQKAGEQVVIFFLLHIVILHGACSNKKHILGCVFWNGLLIVIGSLLTGT